MDANPWREWYDQQTRNGAALPERIRTMHRMYGKTEGETCKNCIFLLRKRYAKTYIKCSKTVMTSGAATDWRTSFPACGKFERGNAIIEQGD